MNIVGIIVYVVVILLVLTWVLGTRDRIKTGGTWQVQTLVTLFLSVSSLVLVPILKWSPLNLLWMIPTSYLAGFLSMMFPFSLLQPFGRLMGMIACVGLNQAEVVNNVRRRERLLELINQEEMSPEEARKKMEQDGEW
jgi:hypothetical protein